jgi:YD repeat-containing protein
VSTATVHCVGGRGTAVRDPDGSELRYDYDTELRLTALTNPLGRRWRYEYDAADRPTALRTGHHAVLFQRDLAGREIQHRMGDTLVAQNWDAAHRLTSQTVTSATVRCGRADTVTRLTVCCAPCTTT